MELLVGSLLLWGEVQVPGGGSEWYGLASGSELSRCGSWICVLLWEFGEWGSHRRWDHWVDAQSFEFRFQMQLPSNRWGLGGDVSVEGGSQHWGLGPPTGRADGKRASSKGRRKHAGVGV